MTRNSTPLPHWGHEIQGECIPSSSRVWEWDELIPGCPDSCLPRMGRVICPEQELDRLFRHRMTQAPGGRNRTFMRRATQNQAHTWPSPPPVVSAWPASLTPPSEVLRYSLPTPKEKMFLPPPVSLQSSNRQNSKSLFSQPRWELGGSGTPDPWLCLKGGALHLEDSCEFHRTYHRAPG